MNTKQDAPSRRLMPTLGRKLRIGLEWAWGMFFPADITHLRFTRTAEADPAAVELAQAAAPHIR